MTTTEMETINQKQCWHVASSQGSEGTKGKGGKMNKSNEINELAGALAKAQAEVAAAHKSSDNPFFKSKYADLASVWDACRGPLTKHGLSVAQFPMTEIVEYKGVDDKGKDFDGTYAKVTLVTLLLHSSGQWIKHESFTAEAKDAGPQSIGSAVTYLRRYALQSIAGVAPDDDDGNAAQRQQQHRPVTRTVTSNGSGVTPQFAAFEGFVNSTGQFASFGEAMASIRPELERLGLKTPAAIRACADESKFTTLKKALEEKIAVPA